METSGVENTETSNPDAKDQADNMSYTKLGSASDTGDENTFTVEEAVEKIGFGKFQWKLSIITGIAWMADAMELMILSIISPELRCQWQLYTWQEALITTVVFVGMMLSSSLWGNLCDKFGRRVGLIICVVWTFYFGFISSFSPTYFWILFLRGMVGIGVGGVPQSVTLYSEFLPKKSRATCIMLLEIFWAVGTCFEVVLALIVMPTLGWRYLLAFSALPLMFFTICCYWLPESARYNVQCGNADKAYTTLKAIAVENKVPMPLGKLYVPVVNTQQKRGQIIDLFKSKELRVTTILLWLIWFNCTFAYYGVVLMTTELLQQEQPEDGTCFAVGNSTTDCNLSCKELSTSDYVDLLWTTLAEFPGLLLTAAIINVVGRKLTMGITFIIFAIFTMLLNICTSRQVMIVFLFIARASISGGFQAAYVYTPEVYPTSVRAIGLGSCSGIARLGAIITPFVAQVTLKISFPLAVCIYAAISLIAGILTFCLPIETKGRDMKESLDPH